MDWWAYVPNEEERKCVQCFGDETGMKEPLGRPRLRWKDNTKMCLMEDVRRAWTVGFREGIILKWDLRKEVRRAWSVSFGGNIILNWALRKEVRKAWTVGLAGRIILK